MKIITLLSLLTLSLVKAHATTEGIKKGSLIQGHTRPCCNFVSGAVTSTLGVFAITEKEELKVHRFGGDKREKVGLVYACKAGFIDISHLRDNVDWTGHLYAVLPEMVGSGKVYPIQKEHVNRSIYMKRVPQEILQRMTREDFARLAQRIAYDLSVWHEILTGMSISSFDPTGTFKDEMSTFSLEDNFSNLLGTYVGAEAALSDHPFNEAVVEIMQGKLQQLEVVSAEATLAAHESVYNKWWNHGIMQFPDLHQVTKRHMDPYAIEGVTSFRIPRPEIAGCGPRTEGTASLEVPRFTTTGIDLGDFYEIRIQRSIPVMKFIAPHMEIPNYLTEQDFPLLIDVIKKRYQEIFGEGYDRE